MRISALPALAALCAALGIGLTWLWVTPQGQLRDAVHWREPAALRTDYRAMGPALAQIDAADMQRSSALLDRPLFSMTRRPPQLMAAAPVDTAPDRLSQARLRAIVEGPQAGGSIIVEIDGKSHRIQTQRAFEGWTLQSLDTQARTATLTRSGQTRVLTLQRGQLSAGPARARASSTRPPLPRPAPSISAPRAAPRPGSLAVPPGQAADAPPADGTPPAPPTLGSASR